MEISLIIHSAKIILNSLQNCQNPKSHILSAFSKIWHKIYFHGIKKIGKTHFAIFFVKQLYKLVGQEMSFYYRK